MKNLIGTDPDQVPVCGFLGGMAFESPANYSTTAEINSALSAIGKSDIINGQFRIAQKGTSFAAAADGVYHLDGWLLNNTSGAVVTVAQAAGDATGKFKLAATVTTADASIAAGDFIGLVTRLKGYDCIKYVNKTFVLGFKVQSPVAGVHCLRFYNGAASYVVEYTINAANTWETKSVVVVGGLPALNSYTNGYGFDINWGMASGSTYQCSANAWTTGAFAATASQVNAVGTNGNVFALQDVTINLGTVVGVNEISYSDELCRCQEQYQILSISILGYHLTANNIGYCLNYPVPMIGVPTAALSGGTYVNASGLTASSVTANSARVYAAVTTTGACEVNNWVLTLEKRL